MIRAIFFSIFDVHEGPSLPFIIDSHTDLRDRPQSFAPGTRRFHCSFHWILTDPSVPLPISLLVYHPSAGVLLQTHHLLHASTPRPLPSRLPPLINLPTQCLHILHRSGLGCLNTICFLCYRHTQASLAIANSRGAISILIARCFSTEHRENICSL